MSDHVHAWRKKLRLQILVEITKHELESDKEITQIYETLDSEMLMRWKLVSCTRKQYLNDVKKILANQYVLVI